MEKCERVKKCPVSVPFLTLFSTVPQPNCYTFWVALGYNIGEALGFICCSAETWTMSISGERTIVTDKKGVSTLCPGCHLPLMQAEHGSVCSRCGWTVVFSDDGNWFTACYRGSLGAADLERIREMRRLYEQVPTPVAEPVSESRNGFGNLN
jgi:hypothetical protein